MRKLSIYLCVLLSILLLLSSVSYADFGPPSGGGGAPPSGPPPSGGGGAPPPGGGGFPGMPSGGGGFPGMPGGSGGFPGMPSDGSMPGMPPGGIPEGTMPGMPGGMPMIPGMPGIPSGIPEGFSGMPNLPGSGLPPSGTGWTAGSNGGWKPPENFNPPDWWKSPEGWTPGQELPKGASPWEQITIPSIPGMSGNQDDDLKKAAQTGMMGFMPNFSSMGDNFDFSKVPEGIIPKGLMPEGGFKPGEMPSSALPPGFALPEGLQLPPDIKVQVDVQGGIFKAPDGKPIELPKNFQPPKGPDGKTVEIPKLSDGRLLPVPITDGAAAAEGGIAPAQEGSLPPLVKNQLYLSTGIDFSNIRSVDPKQFTEKFKNMPMGKLEDMGKDTLNALYDNLTPDKLDITDPAVQERMDKVYTERNKTLGIGDIEEKVKNLNKLAPEVLSLSPESLDKELANLEAMKTKGIGDKAKIEEAIIKTKDAKASQLRLNAIHQQVAQLTDIKQRLEKRSRDILTQISDMGSLTFTPKEQKEIEEEIKASGSGSVVNQPEKIKTLIDKYSKKITPTSVPSSDALKLASLYEKSNDMAKAQEVLSKAMDKNPDDDVVAIKMAQLYEKSNELDKAAEAVEKALKATPLPQSKAMLAEIKEKQGNMQSAVANIEDAIKDAPKTDAFYEKANELYKKNGDTKDFKVFVDGSKVAFDVPPKVEDGRTLVPVRALTEAMGADVKWDANAKTATITKGEKTIKLTAGSNQASVDGKLITLDVPAKIDEGRVLVPLRFIGENLDKNIGYLGETKLISVNDK